MEFETSSNCSENSESSHISCSSRETLDNSLPQSAIMYTELNRFDIEKIIGMKPIDIMKYRKAFVHKSVVKTQKNQIVYLNL